MGKLAVPAIGAAVGGWLGGAQGAMIGWTLGSAISGNGASSQKPSVGDLRVQTSQYGGGINVVCGVQPVTGNIIWAKDKTTYEIKESNGKGQPDTVTTGYRVSMAIALCKGPIKGVRRIWADDKLIVDATTEAKPLIGELYLGTNVQIPDPTMESDLGAGNVPAYRGLAYIVLSDFDLGVTGQIPTFRFEVISENAL